MLDTTTYFIAKHYLRCCVSFADKHETYRHELVHLFYETVYACACTCGEDFTKEPEWTLHNSEQY